MIANHTLTVHGTCPVDGQHDVYKVTVTTAQIVKVEDILAAVSDLKQPIFQEAMTQELAERFDCRVTSTGTHSGVETVCTAWGKTPPFSEADRFSRYRTLGSFAA